MSSDNVISFAEHEVEFNAVRARGPGGQNVNKVSSAIHLRFNIRASSLPETCKQSLLELGDRRINRQGIVVIKASRHRSQDLNRADALQRLQELVQRAGLRQKPRRPTRPSKSAKAKRMNSKTKRGRVKALRGRVVDGG